MVQLQEYIFAVGFFNLYTMEQLMNIYLFALMRPGFGYTQR